MNMDLRILKALSFVALGSFFFFTLSVAPLQACCGHPEDVAETRVDLLKIKIPKCTALLGNPPINLVYNQYKGRCLRLAYQTNYENKIYTLELELEPCCNNHFLKARLLGYKNQLQQPTEFFQTELPEQTTRFLMMQFTLLAQGIPQAVAFCLFNFFTNILLISNNIETSKKAEFDVQKINIPQEAIFSKYRLKLEHYERLNSSLSAFYSLNIAQQQFKLLIDIQKQDGMLIVRLHGRQQKSFPEDQESELRVLFRYREDADKYEDTINFALENFFRDIYYQIFDSVLEC